MRSHAHSFFDSTDRITVTFSQGDIRFSAPAVRKLDSTLVELLIHPKKLVFAVRNAGKDCRNAMQWSKKKDGKNSPREISGTAFLPTLYSLLGWNDDCRYRITGVKRGMMPYCSSTFPNRRYSSPMTWSVHRMRIRP